MAKSFLYFLIFLVCLSACQQKTQETAHAGTPTSEVASKKVLTDDQKIYYETQGEEIVTKSTQALGQKLMAALSDGGVDAALNYCNLNALPLTDSLSKAMGVTLQRTSLNYRNIANQPQATEIEILNSYTQRESKGESLKPITAVTPDGDVLYASPILVNILCLKCHGKVGEDVQDENYALVKELYPYDKAIGYKAGDFRGMWVVKFPQ